MKYILNLQVIILSCWSLVSGCGFQFPLALSPLLPASGGS